MKLNRHLYINNTRFHVIEERVKLDLTTPGRAMFLCDSAGSAVQPKQIVSFSIGYSQHDTMQRLFLGFVETVNNVDRRQRIFCRELSAALYSPLRLDLRHVTMQEVIAEIKTKTGQSFSVGAGSYSSTKVANFFSLGNGYQAMQHLEQVFQIPNYIWQQQGHGVIYAGSWDDSRWASKPITLPAQIFNQHLANNSAKLAAIPALRPGVLMNGNIITQLEFTNNQMTLLWKKQ